MITHGHIWCIDFQSTLPLTLLMHWHTSSHIRIIPTVEGRYPLCLVGLGYLPPMKHASAVW